MSSNDRFVVKLNSIDGSLFIRFIFYVVFLEQTTPLGRQTNELIAFFVVFHLNVVLEIGGRADLDVTIGVVVMMRRRGLASVAITPTQACE